MRGERKKQGFDTDSAEAVSRLNSSLVTTVLVSSVWVVRMEDMAFNFPKVGFDVVKSPAFSSETHPLLIVGRGALCEHHCIHGTAA